MPDRKISILGKALGAGLALALAAPLGATVRDGVEAWERGDYAAAVAEWEGPAAAGDADALFNLGQAYRLGRGVPTDMARAEQLYRAAAEAGHVQAADTYGLMLFQDGRREEALPYVQAAATRGDPRAQYLVGIAHFNGDLLARDWPRAYAMLTLANGAGLPQAATAIGQMDAHIPLEQRQQGVALARQLEVEAEQARSVQLAAADFAQGEVTAAPAPRPAAQAPAASSPVPRPIPSVSVSPSVAAARDAVAQARQATGAEDPAEAGASYARPATPPPAPRPAAAPAPVEVVAAPAPRPAPAAARHSGGPWRVQLGAFGVAGNAERLWDRLSGRPEISGRERLFLPRGRVTVVQAGGFASREEAQAACSSLQRAGHDCLVTRN